MINIVLVYQHLRIGGIETLISRLTNQIDTSKYNVRLILQEGGELLNAIPSEIEIIIEPNIEKIAFKINRIKFIKLHNLYDVDIFWSFNPKSAIIAETLSFELKNTKHISGVYHPRAYFSTSHNILKRFIYKSFFENFNSENMYFMNEDVKNSHLEETKLNVIKGSIIPLSLRNDAYVDINKIDQRKNTGVLKILSIGRYSSFKTYNLYMMEVIDQLNEAGFDIKYDIYGHGPMKIEIIQKWNRMRFKNTVSVNGKLDYEALGTTFSEYDLFIGMGTAALEAAQNGLPVIVAIENEKNPVTYGYIHELKDFNCGEKNKSLIEKSILDLIVKYIQLPMNERKKINLSSYAFAKTLSEEMFLERIFSHIKLSEKTHSLTKIKIYTYSCLLFIESMLKKLKGFYYAQKN